MTEWDYSKEKAAVQSATKTGTLSQQHLDYLQNSHLECIIAFKNYREAVIAQETQSKIDELRMFFLL